VFDDCEAIWHICLHSGRSFLKGIGRTDRMEKGIGPRKNKKGKALDLRVFRDNLYDVGGI